MKTSLALACSLLLGCGSTMEPSAPPSADSTEGPTREPTTEPTAPRAATSVIDGEWTGGSDGGPIQSSLTWRFHGDAYSMDGYPAIGETGAFAITNDTTNADGSHTLVARFSSSLACDGPCTPGAGTPRDDRDVRMILAPDGSGLTFQNVTYARRIQPAP